MKVVASLEFSNIRDANVVSESLEDSTIDYDETQRVYLRVTVEDTGVGISEEDQRHLFKMFGKLKTTFHIN